ncbi:hypothetical protein TWF506_007908 [Arthrobotrys conoides]|uniref:Uncharacterized protein n=1 Tax=Arthrobotrys conoides TaxID=74498 RepID=A0AAN8RTA1_9PEZI
MGCAPSKHTMGKKMKNGRKQDVQIGWPTDFHHNSLSYPSTVCVDCELPSRTLLASLGNTDMLSCNCNDPDSQTLDFKLDLEPMSPISLSPKPKTPLPTSYNFPLGFDHVSRESNKAYDYYSEEYDEYGGGEETTPLHLQHKRYASFSSGKWPWKADHNVVVTTQEVPGSRSNSYASRSRSYASSHCLRSAYEADIRDRDTDADTFVDHYVDDAASTLVSTHLPDIQSFEFPSTLGSESFGPKLLIRERLPFETLNQSSPDLRSACARTSQRVSKDQVKVIRIRGSRSTNWI